MSHRIKGKSRKIKSLKNAAAILGHKGGLKGGPARAAALTPSERSAIAAQGARARNAKKGG